MEINRYSRSVVAAVAVVPVASMWVAGSPPNQQTPGSDRAAPSIRRGTTLTDKADELAKL